MVSGLPSPLANTKHLRKVGIHMAHSIQTVSKLCESKQDKAAPKDKPSPAWQVVHTKTGKTLRHIKVDSKKIDFLGLEWNNLSAFAWIEDGAKVIPHFNEKGVKEMLKLYKLQTGDKDVKIVRVLVA